MEGEYSTTSSDGEEEIEAVAAFVILDEENRRKRRTWVHEINTKREKLGEYHKLVPELRKDPKRFHIYFRMSIGKFDYLHELIEDHLQKENAQLRKAISTAERLTVCVRFLATGNSSREVCDAIWKHLGPIVMPEPTEETWHTVAAKYKNMCHFPNCIGAIDGKHINIQCPINVGSTYYNYKEVIL